VFSDWINCSGIVSERSMKFARPNRSMTALTAT
jgi:hypothetical protein